MAPAGPQLPAAQRAAGQLALTFGWDHPARRTRVQKFYQEGCLKARLPRPQTPAVSEAVIMNIGGGVAGGDTLHTAITLGPGARVCVATAAAERIYRTALTPASIATSITLAPGAALDYLPQETILFDNFALHRTLDVELAETAIFLGVESLIFGRQAMGEILDQGSLRDAITVRRQGKLLLRDATRLDGDIATILRGPATAAGNLACAIIIYAAADAPEILAPVRAALEHHPYAGATLLDGVLRVRILASSAMQLRRLVVAALKLCRNGQAMPRVWQS